ncbi:MAG TPA: response regulator [bacterium]|jgi:CheY-like chemotaxis protein|nr:response regulator [bacterium]
MGESHLIAPILMAEDDPDDQLITRKALEENRVANPLVVVSNGEELLDYLYHRGKFATPASSPKPCFILLDLNMPRMDGRETLKIIKQDSDLKKIPVVILTTSKAEEDILKSYSTGANSYITKPVTFEGLVNVIRSMKSYWLEIVDLPEGT